MHVLRSLFVFAMAALMLAQAHEFKAGDLVLHHPWAKASIPGSQVGAVYLKVINQGAQADALLAVEAGDLAKSIELHTMSMDKGVMKMRQIDKVEIPAKGSALLQPGGDHIMLFNLKRPLQAGEKLPMTFRFAKAGAVKVEVKVEPLDAKAADMHAGH